MARPPDHRPQTSTGRVALVLTGVGVALAAVLVVGDVGAEAGPGQVAVASLDGAGAEVGAGLPAAAGTVTIRPGDTLWEVAVAHAPPGTDPRVYVDRLRDLNDLHGFHVPAWTVLLLPP